ncbi:YceI family protein [Amycolatopsis sp. cg5]|uniref:YceI family protein n=1 Tax=Amycolatopsis sp. cg5 TaxID=3238802 RepID=UPI0035233FC5
MTAETLVAPGLTTGTWTIDVAHSEVAFTVRHMMIATVRGSFESVTGRIEIAEDLAASSIEVEIDTASVHSRNPKRDEHLRSDQFLDVAAFPKATFRSTAVNLDRGLDAAVLAGELTIHGVTKQLDFALRFNGVATDPWGNTKAGFSAEATIDRHDFGLTSDMPLASGGLFVAREVTITIELEAYPETT